ncbi:MAG TPA: NUDIX hydrolase [Rhodopseudomonas sp.]|uniref:NUDIX hydrolase n=1 Tax=Rhodopseudomonas sp. TaxID=1078 RepID=UPI002ED92A22
MTAPIFHRVAQLELIRDGWRWPFADDQRAAIDAHFAQRQLEKPELFNGRVLLGRNARFTRESFSADIFETDFASFLAWRDWGYPDQGVFNGFGMGALRSSDGAFVLGEMGRHTANAGRVYFPGGTPDPSDLRGDRLDIEASISREIAEETGLLKTDYRSGTGWCCVVSGTVIAILRVLEVDQPGAALRDRIAANLARQVLPELCAIHLVRAPGDFTAAMPGFVTAFLATQWPPG